MKAELAAERKGYGELEAELDKVRKNAEKVLKDTQAKHKAEVEKLKKGFEGEIAKAKKSQGGEGKKGATVGKAEKAEKEKLEKLEREVQKEKDEAAKAKQELEDMLMVLADLEGKQEGYRDRLKKLGEEVSDDEDDDDDDEDGGSDVD